jgi:Protein of unknown function (DUF3426)
MGPRPIIFVAAAGILVIGLVVGWTVISSGREEIKPLTEISDTAVIQSNVQLAHISIATSENFFRQKIYTVSAYLKNTADKPLRSAEVKMVFTDFDGKPVLEYSQKVLSRNQRALSPGSEFRFEIRQENLPRGWNYRVPITEVTKLGY